LPEIDLSKREINLQSMNPGMYFIWFETGKGDGIKKMLITR